MSKHNYHTIAEIILNLPGYQDMTQQEIAEVTGFSTSHVSRVIHLNQIPHGKHHPDQKEYLATVDRLVREGKSDREIARLTNTSYGKVNYTRKIRLGHPPKHLHKDTLVRDFRKLDRAIRLQRARENKPKEKKGLVREPRIEIGDIIDVEIDDVTVDIYPVKLREVSGIHYIFEARSGWTYTLTTVQLNEVLETQKPRKEWRR